MTVRKGTTGRARAVLARFAGLSLAAGLLPGCGAGESRDVQAGGADSIQDRWQAGPPEGPGDGGTGQGSAVGGPAEGSAAPDTQVTVPAAVIGGAAGAVIQSDSAAVGQVVSISATNYAFEAPDRIPGGRLTFRMLNAGHEIHHAQLVKLEDGHSVEDLVSAMTGRGAAPPFPDWAEPVGGPNAVAPGEESNATQMIEPGRYALTCLIPDEAGVPHLLKGMGRLIEVVDKAVPPAELPPAGLSMELVEYDFRLSGPLEPGMRTVRVENAGEQPHEVQLFRLNTGATVGDLVGWLQAGAQGPPPAKPVGGVAALEPKRKAEFSVSLEAGDYALVCFVPDEDDGKMHFEHGMVKQIRVG